MNTMLAQAHYLAQVSSSLAQDLAQGQASVKLACFLLLHSYPFHSRREVVLVQGKLLSSWEASLGIIANMPTRKKSGSPQKTNNNPNDEKPKTAAENTDFVKTRETNR